MSKEESKTLVLENTSRRDLLIETEKKYQKIWKNERIFQTNVPNNDSLALSGEELAKKYPSFLGTMAFPYMNGVLHVGHSFTLSKVEFATGFERMNGKQALFPLGFHCTGLPIKAAADKLVREIEQFGPNFENAPVDEQTETAAPAAAKQKEDPTKFSSKKSKAAQKTGRAKYQFEIMLQLGIPREEIKKFADANYWVYYFPPLCQADCDIMGARIDWRRSFVTTDVNPYFDAFVRWEMNALKASGKIKFGKRYTIFSAKDNQPCMDHDRSAGEAVNPQEYTAIKIKISEWTEKGRETVQKAGLDLAGKQTFLLAATLRPETMYGQNCCYVSPNINYGIFDGGNGEYFICTERAFKNMSYQEIAPKWGHYEPLAKINGSDLIGSKIIAPMSVYPEVRVLPMDTILPNKGTGVVTSVPSDSPDDYITTMDLQNKPDFYKIDKDWVLPPVSVLKTPTYGENTAQALVEEFKIRSPRDKDSLAKAKEIAYKEGYYQGIMVVGKYKGMKVEDAKPKVRQDILDAGMGFAYSEPESLVVSRSGDECIVALQDQWFTDYGEESWKQDALECLAGMNLYSQESRHAFEKVLDWLKNWALSRTYGLGSHIPWDNQYLVESLSDSTVYMAYYTIAHFLHKDSFGKERGLLDIAPEDMTDEVWDYIFYRTDLIGTSNIPKEKLDIMRQSFSYFYPLDLRVSAKDLIPNHLTFCIYVHTALFPKRFWPKAFRTNGHLLLNNEKMSKSTGNFMTLREMIDKFGADASRIALADAGDTFEDANFDESNANAAILRLFNLREWTDQIVDGKEDLRVSGKADHFFDRAFLNEMNELIEETHKHYIAANYKAALKSGLFDLQLARDFYRDAVNGIGLKMHKEVAMRYIEVQALLLTPIAPHFSEWVWREILKKEKSVQFAQFPKISEPADKSVSASLEYIREIARGIREAEGALLRKKKKGNEFDPKKPSRLTIYVTESFPEWQDKCIDLVRDAFESQSLDFSPEFKQKLAKMGDVKNGMKFVNFLKQRLTAGGESAEDVFSRKLPFDETKALKESYDYLKRATNNTKVEQLDVVTFDHKDAGKGKSLITGEVVEFTVSKPLQDAVPGQPGIILTNM